MDRKRVCPETVMILGIADGDMATHTLGVFVTRPVAENSSHVV